MFLGRVFEFVLLLYFMHSIRTSLLLGKFRKEYYYEELTTPDESIFTPTVYEDLTPSTNKMISWFTSAEYAETSEPKNESIWNVSWYVPPHRRGRTPMPHHKFEGVEYNDLPKGHLYKNNNDCDAYHNQCIRDEPYHAPVCAYDTEWNYWYEFFSICQVELENCWAKFLKGVPMRQQGRVLERYYFAGEGHDCLTFARMGKMEETYFDPKRNTRRTASELNYMRDYVQQQIEKKGKPKILRHHSMKAIANTLNAYKLACPI